MGLSKFSRTSLQLFCQNYTGNRINWANTTVCNLAWNHPSHLSTNWDFLAGRLLSSGLQRIQGVLAKSDQTNYDRIDSIQQSTYIPKSSEQYRQ